MERNPTPVAGGFDALAIHTRIVEAREELAAGEDLTADSILRDLEHDLAVLNRERTS